jgi:hypothetical protein
LIAVGGRAAAAIVVAALVMGFLVAKGPGLFFADRSGGPVAFPAAPALSSSRTVHQVLRARELQILGADESMGLWIRESAEGSPGIWITNTRRTAVIEAGVHGNGFPFLLVSDGAIRNFGLGRVDGIQASPILVFRTDDVVRMVFGLGMTEPQQPPFLVQYTADGQKHDVIGHYCDRPDRVCVR